MRLLLLCLLVSCRTSAGQPVETLVIDDVTRAKSKLSCNHCHASAEEVQAGRISPGPPWPGTLQRPSFKGDPQLTDPAKAADRCGSEYQGRGLTSGEQAGFVRYLRSQGPGPAAVYDVTPRTALEARALMQLDGDVFQGEKIWERACMQCHKNGPGYPQDQLSAQSQLEIAVKIVTRESGVGVGMPYFPRQQLTDQDVCDVVNFLQQGP